LIYEALEKTIISSAQAAGGTTRHTFHCIVADFNETAMGFWIDILSCIEAVNRAIHKIANELYGYICVISTFNDDDEIPTVLRAIPPDGKTSGIWCSPSAQSALEYFAFFGVNRKEVFLNNETEQYTELEVIRLENRAEKTVSTYDKVRTELAVNPLCHALVVGHEYTGKRESLRRFCEEYMGDAIPLRIRFGAGGRGISGIVDAWSIALREFCNRQNISLSDEMLFLEESLARERLRTEYSKYTLQKARQFFNLLLSGYCEAAEHTAMHAVVILENIQYADANTREIILETLEEKSKQYKIALYGTCSSPHIPVEFIPVFTTIIDCTEETPLLFAQADISPSLWETAYACKLFYRYFPPDTFVSLFEEQGKTRQIINRTMELLIQNKIIRSRENPEPALTGFVEGVEELLGERCAYIRSLVKNTLLSRLAAGKIAACYQLLEALHELGGGISDELALEALRSDIINGTYSAIEEAIANNSFSKVVGEERAPALYYCYKTLGCLLFSNADEIREIFRTLLPENSSVNIYKSQILTIEASYKMGLHDTASALSAIKESMVISQNSGKRPKIAQVYRIFSLINLSKRELSDALDYLSFAIDDAEKSKDQEELTVSAYYAANAHFIYGNISKAERLIKQAEQTARLAGRIEWALRAQFVLGRFYFEMGKYQTALSIFKPMLENAAGDASNAFMATLDAWVFRTELYLYECLPEKPPALNADGRLFELEASYLIGDYKKTAELAEDFLQNLPEENFLFLEQPDWESGFSQCELLEFTPNEFWSRMCTVWRSLAMCRLKGVPNDEAIFSMSKIMRDERFNDFDPNAPFYFFANYRVLNESSSSEVDRNTAISMAFKRLQRRAGRIDDITTRRTFLANQYWNKILFNTAKDYKLI
jgi:tetratricopeptide (TPR) repeat protein